VTGDGGPATLSITTADGAWSFASAHVASIGRDATNDVVIDHPLVSREHARVQYNGDRWHLQDAGSRNGTFVDGHAVTDLPLASATVARLGNADEGPWVKLEPSAVTRGSAPAGASDASAPLGLVTAIYDVRRDVVRIGRDNTNDVVLDDLLVSRHHAEVARGGDGNFTIVDLGSHNGTFVNGRRVERAVLGGSDLVTIGAERLRLRDGQLVAYSDASTATFAAVDLTVVSGAGQKLLDGVTFALGASSFLGVVGPSGSGKSTLLGALTGYRPATYGSVTYGGRDLYREYDALRRRIGLVPQDDLVQLDLTVDQSLHYAARLRFPVDVSRAERSRRVDEVLDELDLTYRRKLRVRQLSGGQRKRVSVALELLSKPALLFLDEPTSGLDPGLERNMMQLLRELADSGRIVVCVTHSVDSLFVCDRVLCLAPGGAAAYFGPPELAAAHFGCEDWQEVFQDLSTESRDWKTSYEQSAEHARFVDAPLHREAPVSPPAVEPTRRSRGWLRQFTTLTTRYARSIISDRRRFALLLLAAPVLGVVLLLRLPPSELQRAHTGQFHLFSRAVAPLMIVALGLTQISVNMSAREIVKELAIFKRERAVGLSISAYLASKVVVLAVVAILEAVIVVLIATARQGGPADGVILGSGRIELMVVFAATAFAGIAAGLLVSAIVTSEDRLALMLPALLGFQALAVTGTAVASVPSVPVLDQTAYAASASWGFTAAASTARLNELEAFNNAVRSLPLDQVRRDPRGALNVATSAFSRNNPNATKKLGDPAFNHTSRAWSRAMLAVMGIALVCLLGAGIALRRHDPL
jgi:ABC-type multidrug transport system ATPase subunit/pSer/pThr/pTyr-binding forkhead associated (FHA) protein